MDSIDCLQGVFKEIVSSKKLDCTLPWIQSFQGIYDYDSAIEPTCNTSETYYNLHETALNFSQMAASYSHAKCPGN